MLERREPPRANFYDEDFHVGLCRRSEERMAWLESIVAEMELEEALFPVDEVSPHAHEDLPGAAEEDSILVDDSDNDFKGSSWVSSLGS